MPKRVAVIDLGSNSMRLAVFERTSRYGFFIVAEHKIKVRLGEGAYENGGFIQNNAMQKCLNAFGEFKKIIKSYGANRVLCVGTSALRDAPNSNEFINLVKKTHGFNIRRIDGDTEAHLGGIAALNLLSDFKSGICVDIGGGSTELARIQNKKVVEKISLNLGTVRLKELFFDKDNIKKAKEFVDEALNQIPSSFKSDNLIAIGGSLRAISNAIMSLQKYPLKIVHNFSYELKDYEEFINKIINAKQSNLGKFGIKKERFDTIREGAFIFKKVAEKIEAKSVIASGVGVREGVFLTSILGKNARLPENFNVSLKSLQDRFSVKNRSNLAKFAKEIFDKLSFWHGLDEKYLPILINSAKLCTLGEKLGFYAMHNNSAYFVLNALNYGFSHEQKVLIACVIKLHGKNEFDDEFAKFKNLLPHKSVVIWLSFMLEVAKILDNLAFEKLKFEFSNHALKIHGTNGSLMVQESIKKLQKPVEFELILV